MVKVVVTAPVRPTEDAGKVQEAATAWWSDAQVARDGETLSATSSDLSAFRRRIWELRIIDTVRSGILAGCDGAKAVFHLDKQAALQGRISFPVGRHALGYLAVTLTVEPDDPWADAEALAWWLCPETQDGQIVGPTE